MPKKTVDLSQPHAQHDIHAFLDALNTGGGKPMEQMKPKEARRVLEDAQRSVEVPLREVEISEKTIHVEGQDILLQLVRPARVKEALPVFMFFHGGGWVLGDFPTHERLVRDLVHSSGAAAVFVNYPRSPEVRATLRRSTWLTPPPNGWPSTARRSTSTVRGWRWSATAPAAIWRRWSA